MAELKCTNSKCQGELLEEIHVAKWIKPIDEDPEWIPGRLERYMDTGRFLYKCIKCGRVVWPEDWDK